MRQLLVVSRDLSFHPSPASRNSSYLSLPVSVLVSFLSLVSYKYHGRLYSTIRVFSLSLSLHICTHTPCTIFCALAGRHLSRRCSHAGGRSRLIVCDFTSFFICFVCFCFANSFLSHILSLAAYSCVRLSQKKKRKKL